MTTRKKKNTTKDESIIRSEQINQVPIGKLAEDAYIEFGGYINNFRHLSNISDGVKVSYRRLIYTVLTKFPHTSLTHTNTAIAAVASIHPAGLAGFNDMCATLVKAGVFKGSGSFGYSQIDGVKNDPAADRYTSIAISDLYWGIMGDLIKEVPYVESPNGNPEPLYLPTPLPLCLSGDTKIRLADGRNLEISKLVEEFKSGKDNYVLSCSPDGDFRMSKVIWGDKTKEANEFIRITLDNGEIIDSTEDHLFMMRSGDYVKAGELKEGDSLMPGYFSYNSSKRECIKNNYSLNNVPIYHLANMYNIEHEIYEDDPEKIAIHHVDKNKDNNNPTNIIKLTRKEHSEAHKEEFIKMVNDPEIRARIKESNKKYWEDPINHILAKRRWEETGDIPLENGKTRREISRETRISYNISEKSRENTKNFWEDPERSKEAREKLHDILTERNSDPEFQKHAAEQRRQWLKTEEGKEFSKKHAEKLRERNSDPEFQKKTVRGRILSHFKRLVNKEGLTFENAYKKLEDKIDKWFDSKEDFIEKEKTYNHKVVKIERISEELSRDFYDITVDSRYHNFLLSAGVVVHNCLQLKTISQGLGVGISTIYPNFSPWSLYQAYKHNNPNLLEPNVDLILDKKNSELKKLWETGQGRVIYAYKISRYTNPETGLEGILFETKDGTEIFTPKLKPLRKLEEDGKIYIEDLTDYDSCKMAVYRIPGARGVTIDDIETLCRKCCFSSTTFNLNVTDSKSAFRIPLYAWIDFTYKRYIDLVTKANQRKIKKTEFDIAVFEAIPIVANYILNINPKATDKELVSKLGMPEEIISTVLGKPISYLRKNSDTTGKVKELKAHLKELKKFNPITYTEEIIKRL